MFCIFLFAISLPNCKGNISEMGMGEGSRGEVRKGWNMLSVQGCICYLHILGARGSVKEQGLILHLKTEVWERSFSLIWRFYFSPVTATTFSVRLTESSDEPRHETGNKELVFYSAMSVLPPLVPLAQAWAPEQASAFLLLCHPAPFRAGLDNIVVCRLPAGLQECYHRWNCRIFRHW